MKRKAKSVRPLASINAVLAENKERVLARQLARELNRKELREVSGGACKRTDNPDDVWCPV